MDFLVAIILGFVEGLTEFLPVSSTGHLILTADLLDFEGDLAKTFEIVIQLGSILAVVVVFWKRFLSLFWPQKFAENKTTHLNLIHIILAMIPAVILGLLLHDAIKTYLFSPYTVLIGLIVGGILMIVAEKRKPSNSAHSMDQLTYKQAFYIGLFQCLALWPGFSRSGATISGGLLVGADRKTSSEFTFIVAVPMMVAASGLDVIKNLDLFTKGDIPFFAVGFITAFLVALAAIFFFLKIIAKVRLTGFAYYRFILAALFLLFLLK